MAGHAPRTLSQYRLSLEQFAALAGVRFVDEVTVPVLRRYKLALHKEGYAGKTSLTRLNIVRSLLKKYKNDAKLEKNEKPRPVKNSPDPYSEEDLAKLFGAMDAAERIRFRFFLGSACREQEVQFAEWSDLNLTAKTYIVREKNDVGFAPKNRQSRTVPLPTNLCEDLKEWKKKSDGSRWVFPSKHGLPDGHLLRKLKSIAERAGLDPEKCYLHRFRKTCATRWSDNGTSVRKIQIWLGHESLEVTQKYLGEGSNVNERENIDNAFGD
jgi:integrase